MIFHIVSVHFYFHPNHFLKEKVDSEFSVHTITLAVYGSGLYISLSLTKVFVEVQKR